MATVTRTRVDLQAGMRDVAPILPGLFPFGMVVGVSMTDAGFSPIQTIASSVFMFTGAGQLAIAELTQNGALPVIAVLTALVVSLRMVMYSASLAPYLQRLSQRRRGLLATLLVDQPYALSMVKFAEDESTNRFWYFLGTGIPMWLTWQVSTVAGIVFGASIPQWLDVGFFIPLMFIAILVPALDDRVALITAVSAGFLALAARGLPFELGILAGALGGMLVGATADWGGLV